MTEAPLPRQTGQEQSTRECPNCGAPLSVVERPGGSTTVERCTKCYPESAPTERTTASAQAPRLTGTATESAVPAGVAAPVEIEEKP